MRCVQLEAPSVDDYNVLIECLGRCQLPTAAARLFLAMHAKAGSSALPMTSSSGAAVAPSSVDDPYTRVPGATPASLLAVLRALLEGGRPDVALLWFDAFWAAHVATAAPGAVVNTDVIEAGVCAIAANAPRVKRTGAQLVRRALRAAA